MTTTTPKGFPVPQDGIDYLIDAADHFAALATAVDEKLDEYKLVDNNGLASLVKTLTAEPVPIGTSEVAVLTSDLFTLTAPTQLEVVLSWDSLTPNSYYPIAQWRIRPGNIGNDAVGGCRTMLFQSGSPDGGGSFSCYPILPAGTWSILSTLQISSGNAQLHASVQAPLSLLVRSMP